MTYWNREKIACGNCKWWQFDYPYVEAQWDSGEDMTYLGDVVGQGNGRCHKNAPSPDLWPITKNFHSCGEFEKRPVPFFKA